MSYPSLISSIIPTGLDWPNPGAPKPAHYIVLHLKFPTMQEPQLGPRGTKVQSYAIALNTEPTWQKTLSELSNIEVAFTKAKR